MKKLDWLTWETFVLAAYIVCLIRAVFTDIGQVQEAYVWDWQHVAFGIVWSIIPLISTWSLAKKHAVAMRSKHE